MIQVGLSAHDIAIEPGGTGQLTITITNNQPNGDHVAVEIEGIDVEWYALPVPSLNVAAGETQEARVLFRIAHTSECLAGTYPFVVKCRSMETGEAGVQQAVLTVKPFSSLQIELEPRRAASTFFRHASPIDVTITNLGNHDETLDLYASDPEDACAYEFETNRITVRPGLSVTVPMEAEPVTRPMIGSTRLYGYTVTARSTEDSYVSAAANGQLERKALISTVAFGILAVLAALLIVFMAFRPRPVAIRSFTSSAPKVVAGQKVTLSWDIANMGDGSYIMPGNIPVTSSVGSRDIQPTEPTNFTLVARGAGGEQRRSVMIDVTPAPPMPKPEISEFSATPRKVHQGDSVTLAWQVKGASEIVLNPLGEVKNPQLYLSQEVKPEQTTTYVLTARGLNGQVVTKSITVDVIPPTACLAEIRSFRAKPSSVETGKKSTLSWSVDGAATVEIDNGVGAGLPARGKADVSPTETTMYVLRATDSRGNTTTRNVTVTVAPPAPAAPTDSTAPPQ